MPHPQLSPVPPLTAAGFTDPVWLRWLQDLRAFLNTALQALAPHDSVTAAAPPTGFTLAAAASTRYLLLSPAAPLASGTVTLPTLPAAGQLLTVLSTQDITSFAAAVAGGSGHTLVGYPGPALLPAHTSLAFLFDDASASWYKL